MRVPSIYKAFTLVEILIVVAIIGIIVAIAMPAFMRAREVSRSRACQENLAKIEGAAAMYALENKLNGGDPVSYPDDLVRPNGTGYLKSVPSCPSSGTYSITQVDQVPTCSIGANGGRTYAQHILR